MTDDYVIIVAGGKGLRMQTDVPKQFLPIGGMPILMRTIRLFRKFSGELGIIVVLPKEQQDYWQELCRQQGFREDYHLADGGETRFHSVRNGLALIPDNCKGVVGVHDGVRPFASIKVIASCYNTAHSAGTAIPVIPVVETLRKVGAEGGLTVARDNYRLVQTPQVFKARLLKKAYRQDYSNKFTDDASVVENLGETITLVEGNRENIKITTPYDLMVAETLVARELQ